MKTLRTLNCRTGQRGSTLVEYCLLSVLTALFCVAILSDFRVKLFQPFIKISTILQDGGSYGTEDW